MANLTPTAVSKSSNFVTGPSGDRTNEVLSDLLANRTEIYSNLTNIADEFYGATPPANPNVGRKWRCSTTAGLYVANTTYRWNGSAWAIDIAETVNVPQRNCVLEGPVSATGVPILFSAGTGLACDLKATVRISFANGFTDEGGASDYFESITSDDAAFWSALPINSTVQLYINRASDGTVTGGYSTLAPVYQNYAPSHSAGLNWFDTNTQKMFVSNGSAWTQVWRVFVGTATTDSTETTSVSIDNYSVINELSVNELSVNELSVNEISADEISTDDIITKGPWVDVRAFGAVGNGVADDTAAIQAALNLKGNVLIPDGTYVTNPLFVKSDTALQFSPKATLLAKAGYGANDCLVSISAESNVTILGNGATLKMLKADYTTGEWRHCLNILGGTNIKVYDLNCVDSGGDGYYINGENISLINCIADNNKRNGLSIISAKNLLVLGGEYKNSTGTNPQFGIDIEPNAATDYLENVKLIGVKTSGNARGGISVVPLQTTRHVSVYIRDYISDDDGLYGMLFALSPTAKQYGIITVENAVINEKLVYLLDWTKNCPIIKMRNVIVVNAGTYGFLGEMAHDQNGLNQGNIDFENCGTIDTRTPVLNVCPARYVTSAYGGFENIRIKNQFANAWTDAAVPTPFYFDATSTAKNVVVSYDQEFILRPSVDVAVLRNKSGATISNSVDAVHVSSLPLVASNLGMEISYWVEIAGSITITPNAADTISGSIQAASIVLRNVGDRITLRAVGATTWAIISGGVSALSGSATWDPGSLADGVGETSAAITVTGASLGDFVMVAAPYDLQGITCNGYVSATNAVKIRLQNETGGPIDLASGTWKVKVIK